MAGENSGEQRPKGKPRGRPFPKGVSGNPGGRPKGFAERIREATRDGEDLLDFALAMLHGKSYGESKQPPGMQFRVEAWKWLAERAFGKPVQGIELTGAEGGPLEVEATKKTEVQLDASPERLAAVIDVLRESGLLEPGLLTGGAPAGEAPGAAAGADAEGHEVLPAQPD
ncbi:MAG: hypothetical protein ACK4N5_25175 [Myxococcales bacterium]